MKNIQLIRHIKTQVHNGESDDLRQSHSCVHYMVGFIWDPASFHNYITASFHNYILEMLNLLFFLLPLHLFSILTQIIKELHQKRYKFALNLSL